MLIEAKTVDDHYFELKISSIAHADYFGQCMIKIVQVTDWYDHTIECKTKCVIESNILTVSLHANIENGLYLLQAISIETNDNIIAIDSDKLYLAEAFTLGIDTDKTQEELKDIYHKVVRRRDELFEEPKGNVTNGDTQFDCFIFVKNINPISILQYGDIEIIPFNEYRYYSEAKMIDAFFAQITPGFDYSSTLKGEFGAVIYMKNVLAQNEYKEAIDYALNKADILVNLYSLLNRDNAQIIASVVQKVGTDQYWINVVSQRDLYQGNLLRLGDFGYSLRNQYTYLSNNDTNINVYIKMYNEAVKETDRMAAYYKYWSLIEVIAECEGIVGDDKKTWDGSTISGRDSMNKKILSNNVVDVVYELLRRRFSSELSEYYFRLKGPANVEDFLKVAHQRRNCYAHRGKCDFNNPLACNYSKTNPKLCKDNMTEKITKNSDQILMQLEDIVRRLIYSEINKVITPAEDISKFVDSILKK